VGDLQAWRETIPDAADQASIVGTLPSAQVTAAEWNFSVGRGAGLFEKLSQMPVKLGDVATLFVGLQTDADDVFILKEIKQQDDKVLCESKATGQQHWFENGHLKPFLKGSLNIRRYLLANVNKRLIFPYEIKNGKSVLITPSDYKHYYPLTWSYLELNRERLSGRSKGALGKEWYGYVYKKNHLRFASPKLLVPSIATGSCFAADMIGIYYFVGSGGGGGGGYGIRPLSEQTFSTLYLLGVLNSSLQSWHLKQVSTSFRGGYLALNRQYIEQLPIRTINFSDPAEVQQHARMVALVERMQSLQGELAAAQTPAEKTRLQRQVDATDAQIDVLVYELYGLTQDEIALVEDRR
jgi:hypothetical protein